MPEIIQKNPKILGGQPTVKGTRIPISRVLALVGMGYTLKELKKELPDLSVLTRRNMVDILSYYQKQI